ncbi:MULTISPECIES: hypothetical protein [unclassified Halomonas]|uniref:hypothetical protein n=1 Tax=unclassified Halomonas TaxID=2609666 RepID=UPI0040339F41
MNRTIVAIAIGAIFTSISAAVLANENDASQSDGQMTQQQNSSTAGQQQSTDTPRNQEQGDTERETGTQGPQQSSESDDLDMPDQADIGSDDTQNEQGGNRLEVLKDEDADQTTVE